MEAAELTQPFEFKIPVSALKSGFVVTPGMLFDGDMDDLIEEIHSVEVDGSHLVVRGNKQKSSPNLIVTDGEQKIIEDLPTS